MVLRLGALLAVAFAIPASAQFQLSVNINGNSTFVQNGATLSLSAPVGGTQTAQITAIFTGTGQATISQNPSILGSGAFQASAFATVPFTVQQGQSFTFN